MYSRARVASRILCILQTQYTAQLIASQLVLARGAGESAVTTLFFVIRLRRPYLYFGSLWVIPLNRINVNLISRSNREEVHAMATIIERGMLKELTLDVYKLRALPALLSSICDGYFARQLLRIHEIDYKLM